MLIDAQIPLPDNFKLSPYDTVKQYHIFKKLTLFRAENRNTKFQFFVQVENFLRFAAR